VPRFFYRYISPLALLLIWELASHSGLVNALILPPPSGALADLMKLALDGELLRALWASLYRILCGFTLAVVIGIGLGAVMARIRLLDLLLDPLVQLLRPPALVHRIS
jgi:sulfonate transport system permease protein